MADQPKAKPKKVDEVFRDPTSIYQIKNPQVLPPLTQGTRMMVKDLLHSININNFKVKSQNLIQHLNQDKRIKEMLIKVKELNSGSETKLPKYEVELFPVYQKFMVSNYVSWNVFCLNSTLHNLTNDSFKQFRTAAKWNYRENKLSLEGEMTMYGPWSIAFKKTWGKPLDRKWVTDCREFGLNIPLRDDTRKTGGVNTKDTTKSVVFFNMKGYDTRKSILYPDQPGLYADQAILKRIDILETGYNRQLVANFGAHRSRFLISVGTDYYNTWYCRAKSWVRNIYLINSRLALIATGELGMIGGKNVIPHEMFSRNETNWMGQRSRLYGHGRLDLAGRGIIFLETIGLMPTNYVSLWASKSYQNKIKLQAEFGVSLSAINSPFRIDLSLLRMSGVKGEPKMGLKFEF